jgi:hypothetical protein
LLSRRVDERQKKVVYKSFSESPLQVLTVEVEENPPTPKAKDHVVLKVAVRGFGLGVRGYLHTC